MVAQAHGVVTCGVHELDGRGALGERHDRHALRRIARINQQAVGGRGVQGRDIVDTNGRGAISLQVAMDVVRVIDDDLVGAGSLASEGLTLPQRRQARRSRQRRGSARTCDHGTARGTRRGGTNCRDDIEEAVISHGGSAPSVCAPSKTRKTGQTHRVLAAW